jgi:hypothetical protein
MSLRAGKHRADALAEVRALARDSSQRAGIGGTRHRRFRGRLAGLQGIDEP